MEPKEALKGLYGRLEKWAKRLGVGGALFGFLVSVIAQPFVSPALIGFYHQHEVGQYQTPPLDAELVEEADPYQEGDQIGDFNNLTWKPSYDIYRLQIVNRGKEPINLEMAVPLPGCAVYTNERGPQVSGDFEVENMMFQRMPQSAQVDKYHCTKVVTSKGFTGNEEIRVEFVVTDEFDKCDLLLGYHPQNRAQVYYDWWEGSRQFSVQGSKPIEGLESAYTNPIQNRTKYHLGKHEYGDGIFRAFIVGVEAENDVKAIEKCRE